MKRAILTTVLCAGLPLGSSAAAAARGAAEEPRSRRNVAILVYPHASLLDLAGPADVFEGVRAEHGPQFDVHTVGTSREPVVCSILLSLRPEYTFDDCLVPDVVVVPGGPFPVDVQRIAEWRRDVAEQAEVVTGIEAALHGRGEALRRGSRPRERLRTPALPLGPRGDSRPARAARGAGRALQPPPTLPDAVERGRGSGSRAAPGAARERT
ncbi:MAG: DJ-1/PfpI family protein [Candidatus Krumholzibacteriia bacterium]